MSESNTEHTNVKLEDPEQTTLNGHTIFLDYHFEDLLYPVEELEKWKRKLKIMRSEANSQFENSQPLATRSNDDQPLRQVHGNIINKSGFSNLTDENSDSNTTTAETVRVKTNENNSKSINIDKTTNNVQKSEQRKSLKVERPNRMNAKETDVIFTRSNATNDSANTNKTLLRLKRLDLQKKL